MDTTGRSNLKNYRPSTGSQHTPVPRPINPFAGGIDRSREPSQSGTPQPPRPSKSDSGRSTPSTTASRSIPPSQSRTGSRIPFNAPPPTPRARGAQIQPDQSSPQSGISSLLAVIKDQQTAILTQNAAFDLSLRDLVAGLTKLSDRVNQREEDTKEREAKDKAKEEKEQGQLKVLTLLAQGVDDVRKRVVGIETVIGARRGDETTILDSLQNIEMHAEEWLERARDPDAAMALDRRGETQPPTPASLSPAVSVVRHEMAVSPIKLPAASQAAPTRTPEPHSPPKPTKMDISTQVDISDEPPTQPTTAQRVTDPSSLCAPCSSKLHSLLTTHLHSRNDVLMSDPTPSHSEGGEMDTTSSHDSHQVIDDDPFLTQPDVSLSTLASTTTSTEMTDRQDKSPVTPRSETPENLALGSFSPADWRTNPAPSAEGPSSNVPSTTTPSQSTSYTLPTLPEGTVAALRQEALVDPYPFPLESAGLGDGNGLVVTMPGVVGAGVEAAQRIPSPESQCDEDDPMGGDDNPEETTPKVCDTQCPESKRSSSPTPQPNAVAITLDGENTPIPSTRIMGPLLRAISTESSLTSLSSDPSARVEEDEEDSLTPRPPDRHQVQTSTPVAVPAPIEPPASRTSNATEDDEDAVMALVMDAPPTSPARPPSSLSQTTPFSPLRVAASTLVLVSPELGKTRRSDGPENDDGDDDADDDDNRGDTESLMKLQAWYKEQRMKVLSKQENHHDSNNVMPEHDPATAAVTTTTRNDDDTCDDNPILDPASPLFTSTSPDVSPLGPAEAEAGHSHPTLTLPVSPLVIPSSVSTHPKPDGNDDSNPTPPVSPLVVSSSVVTPVVPVRPASPTPPVSPLFTSPGITPPKLPDGNAVPVRPEPPAFLKKLVEIVNDDDADIVPSMRDRTSATPRPVVGSKKGKEKAKPPPSRQQVQPQQDQPKLKILSVNSKSSKAKTRIKKRKVSQEPTKIGIESEDEPDEAQPPLKRVRLRLAATAAGSSRNTATTTTTTTTHKLAMITTGKPKSVTVVSPVKTTPTRRPRGHPRPASIVWPNIDKPVFDQFIECDICERWYHVGCVGILPDDIRLSASEIYRCPPCEAGVPKEGKSLSSQITSKLTFSIYARPPALPPVQYLQQDDACARPKCLCPRRKRRSNIKTETTFTVESFVGMVKKAVGGRGIKLVYLVKWQGYDFEDATWEEETAMGLPNPGFFVEKFEEQARKEGIDLTVCNSEASLLECAVEAGWKPNGVFIKKEG